MKDFHTAAHKYIGVPFKHHGRTMRGLDCVGLLILAARDCGYDRYQDFTYGREPRDSVLQGILQDHFGPPVDRDPQINDVVLLRLSAKYEPSHVGIITFHPYGLGIIHAYGAIERVAYQLFTAKLAAKIAGVYQWPEQY